MKLELNKQFAGLDNKLLSEKDLPMGKLLASGLATANTGDAVKFWDWAMLLYAEKPIEIDNSDLEVLLNFVRSNPQFNNLVKAQLHREIVEQVKP